MARKPIGKKLRFDVFKRDEFVCQYCGITPPNAVLQIDHVIAVADGGSNEIDNLVTCCQPCNIGKGARPLTDVPAPLKQRMSEIKEREDQLFAYNALLAKARDRKERQKWAIAAAIEGVDFVDSYNKIALDSISMLLDRIAYGDALQAAELARSRINKGDARFKYFCGICWNVIRSGWKS